jgi:hypothetical protein
MRLAFALALSMSAMIPRWALADPSPAAAAPARPTDCGHDHRRATCVLEFDPEDVAGKAATPDGVAVRILTFAIAGSLVSVRHHFIPEILKTAEDL